MVIRRRGLGTRLNASMEVAKQFAIELIQSSWRKHTDAHLRCRFTKVQIYKYTGVQNIYYFSNLIDSLLEMAHSHLGSHPLTFRYENFRFILQILF